MSDVLFLTIGEYRSFNTTSVFGLWQEIVCDVGWGVLGLREWVNSLVVKRIVMLSLGCVMLDTG